MRRDISRPALTDERAQLISAGPVELKLKTPGRHCITHLLILPLKFVQLRVEWQLFGSQISERCGSNGVTADRGGRLSGRSTGRSAFRR